VQLPPTLVFDYPSLSAIVGYLDDTLAAQQQQLAPAAAAQASAGRLPAAAPTTGPARQLAAADQAAVPLIAVVATHGRFPQPAAAGRGVPGLVSLVDGIAVVPVERYDVELRLTEEMPARFGGFITGAQVGGKGRAAGAASAFSFVFFRKLPFSANVSGQQQLSRRQQPPVKTLLHVSFDLS
jgi:hypothetical protein